MTSPASCKCIWMCIRVYSYTIILKEWEAKRACTCETESESVGTQTRQRGKRKVKGGKRKGAAGEKSLDVKGEEESRPYRGRESYI